MNDDSRFMMQAIEVARKCTPEPGRTDSTPFVGVVVVNDGKVLATAYRGELGPGEHAEYTVLEKKLQDQSVAGATVYCTLEPCTTRKHPKRPCADWLIERKVARVVIAMLDPNENICGRGERRLRDHNIDVQRCEKHLSDQVEELNRHFISEQKNLSNAVRIGAIADTPPAKSALKNTTLDEAEAFQREALAISESARDEEGMFHAYHHLGVIAEKRRSYAEARAYYEKSLAITKRRGDEHGTSNNLHRLGIIAQFMGDLGEAERLYQEALEIARRLGITENIANNLRQLGTIAQHRSERVHKR